MLKILTWNINGLKQKTQDENLKDYLQQYDIIGLQETWSEDKHDFSTWLPGYKMFTKEGLRTSKYGHCSGGLIVLVKDEISHGVAEVNIDNDHCIFVELKQEVFNFDKNLLLAFVYIPPENSKIHAMKQVPVSVFEMLNDNVLHIMSQKDVNVMICGDMNARCGKLEDYIVKDDISDHVQDILWYDSDNFEKIRRSKDKIVNAFGRELLELCISLKIHIVNGRKESDRKGEFTYCSVNGKSVIDYCLCSTDFFNSVQDFEVKLIDVTEKDTDHFSCEISVKCSKHNVITETNQNDVQSQGLEYEKIVWDVDDSETYCNKLKSEEILKMLDNFDESVETGNVNEAVVTLEEVFKTAAGKMVRKYKPRNIVQTEKENVPWWDNELTQYKRHRNVALSNYRKDRNTEQLDEYLMCKRRFKAKYREKQCEFKEKQSTLLEECLQDNNRLWSLIKKINNKTKGVKNNITSDQWYEYYKGLLNQENELDPDNVEKVSDYLSTHDLNCQKCTQDEPMVLNCNITQNEINVCLKNMKTKKAPGIDGVIIEAVLKGKEIIVPKLEILFNKIMDSGVYPERWCKAILCSLYKGGNRNEPGNYRGISLLSVIGKIFTKIINERLVQWAIDNDECHEEQAGYKRGYSTVDQIFNLQALGQKYLSRKGGRFYAMYVDFSKAFDRIPHKMLLYQMLKRGMHGQIIKVIRSMYSQLKSCIRLDNNCLTEYFDCSVGTRQGCMLSPFLFTFYLNELIESINSGEGNGIYVDEVWSDVKLLLYADDIVLCADTVGNLQKQINILKVFCEKWGMKLNLKKTKVMVFRRGGRLRKNEKWYYGENRMEVVQHYTYLGLNHSTQLTWGPALHKLCQQAQRNLAVIYKLEQYYKNVPINIMLELFEKLVSPILMYGAEIWGYKQMNCIERIQTRFCKHILGLSKTACDAAALGECGKKRLKVLYFSKCIKYWLKLCCLPDNRLNKRCYGMLKNYDEAGRVTWATHIKMLLSRYGFGFVWEEQGVGDIDAFMYIFKERVSDCSDQEWSSEINDMSKTNLLSCIKNVPSQEVYTKVLKFKHLRASLAKLRCGNHQLMIEKGRYNNIPRNERKCILCNSNEVESEEHFVMYCNQFKDLRLRYIDKHLVSKNRFGFEKLLSTKNVSCLVDLSTFLFRAFKDRESKMSELQQ